MTATAEASATTLHRWRRWHWIGPVGLLLAAAVLACLFLVVHLAGWREYTEILSGTLPGSDAAILAGLAYVAAYFSAVLAVPILLLAALFDAIAGRLLSRMAG